MLIKTKFNVMILEHSIVIKRCSLLLQVNQYQYYSVGLLSRLDKYCEKRSLPKKVSSPAIMTQVSNNLPIYLTRK